MSVTGTKNIGIPIILLHDAEGAIVTVELKDGTTCRGTLEESQDCMNLTIKDCIKTNLAGKQIKVEVAYIRGSNLNFIVLPDMLKHAPFFNRIHVYRKYRGQAKFGMNAMISNAPVPAGRGGFGGGGRGFGGGGRGFGGGRGRGNGDSGESSNKFQRTNDYGGRGRGGGGDSGGGYQPQQSQSHYGGGGGAGYQPQQQQQYGGAGRGGSGGFF